ncbi:MAG TPA: TA system VapC family ribonuclease toxin [Burkholderiaceae bacterium]|nr:TA system VapC family ribonuclease toxin [Burkholderiaceae bacterium]
MIAVDTNLLVYAHRVDAEFHAEALARITALAESTAAWAIPWPCLHEFYAIVTHRRIYAPPTPPARALDQIAAWLESPSLVLLAESAGHWSTLKALLASARIQGSLVHDARIAALCLQHGVTTLWTADRDFARFAPLQAVNPLVART